MSAQTSTQLSTLIKRLPQARSQGDLRTIVHGITHDSRHITSGDLFVCLQGASHDGHVFARKAIDAGAAALLVNDGGLARAEVELPADTPLLMVPDTRAALPAASCAIFNDPSYSFTMVGITGTNGKTTTTRMVAAILREAGQSVGTIGTLGAELDGTPIPSEHTTPEADQLQAILAEMKDAGADAVVMEVSSHALAQHRTDGIAFSAGIFTNLTQDHLDFHQTMESYFSAKARLFADYPVKFPRQDGTTFVSVINTTEWSGQYLATLARGEIITFAMDDSSATLRADDVRAERDCTQFEAVYGSGLSEFRMPISLPVGGVFQVGNALAAIGVCLGLGIAWDKIADGLANLPPVPGRFEGIPTGGRGFSVVVDYAHTPDGLKNVLESAQELKPDRIVVVFGCGGNRDRTKRPQMGRLAATLADVAIVTSDNPRHEEPQAIIDEILKGMECGDEMRAKVFIEPDRRTAIQVALEQARQGDLVLIAGKGHEDYQIVGDQVLPFDDRQVVREWFEKVVS